MHLRVSHVCAFNRITHMDLTELHVYALNRITRVCILQDHKGMHLT